ncbi:hypothetical protein niasHT_011750 [Heterodera trifolii]|uniref:Uncharacterized protein n=1 Tax=Heterodera trifolii TaxID=157864 RepID=A0ABD2LGP3_9BILA
MKRKYPYRHCVTITKTKAPLIKIRTSEDVDIDITLNNSEAFQEGLITQRQTNATNNTPPRAKRSMAPAQDLDQNTVALAEQERHRTLVLLGLPESAAALPSERVQEDRKVATKILDHLDVEAEPTAVFRLGRYDPQRTTPRPRKIQLFFGRGNELLLFVHNFCFMHFLHIARSLQ